VLSRPRDEWLAAEAVALAAALPERAARSSVLTRLAPTLHGDALVGVGAALRRLDDGAVRVRALKALAEAIGDEGARQQAFADALRVVEQQLGGNERALAQLMLVEHLPQTERADVLAQASGCLEHHGYTAAELLREAGRQLPFVPYRVVCGVVRWLARFAPSAERTAATLVALPCLPDGSRAEALAVLEPRVMPPSFVLPRPGPTRPRCRRCAARPACRALFPRRWIAW
jgi:hypothetical protein